MKHRLRTRKPRAKVVSRRLHAPAIGTARALRTVTSQGSAVVRARALRALTKQQLIALVLDGQAQLAAARSDDGAIAASAADVSPSETSAPERNSLVISSSVRSGQTIEFPNGDVTIIGSVGSGAEIVAGGSIHVYGTLRGRAIAGTSGDRSARIFCHSLKAELLSIDGCYRVAENFDPNLRGRAVQAYLDEMTMALVPLNEGEAGREAATNSPWLGADRLMKLVGRRAARPHAQPRPGMS